jgi:hypothetical protein
MYLMGHHNTVVCNTKFEAEQPTVLANSLWVITTIAIDVERTVVATTKATVTGGTESSNTLT